MINKDLVTCVKCMRVLITCGYILTAMFPFALWEDSCSKSISLCHQREKFIPPVQGVLGHRT